MDAFWKTIIWQQFGASIDMLENAIRACPDDLWNDRSEQPEYWYVVYHALFWLDFYLSESADGFAPPAPFTLAETDPAGVLPDRVYSKDELLNYLEHGREKCRTAIASMRDEKAPQRVRLDWPEEMTIAEMLLYNLRHVQHHAAQLNLILRQKIDSAPRWVSKARHKLVNEPVEPSFDSGA
jgi:hypothetical protein